MLEKLPRISLYVLMAITVVIGCMFYFGGYVDESAEYMEPTFTNALIIWMYVLVGIAAVATLVAQCIAFSITAKNDKKKAIKSVATICGLALIMLITYLVSDGAPVKTVGDVAEVSTSMIKAVDMQLYTIYILVIISLLAALVGSFAKKFK